MRDNGHTTSSADVLLVHRASSTAHSATPASSYYAHSDAFGFAICSGLACMKNPQLSVSSWGGAARAAPIAVSATASGGAAKALADLPKIIKRDSDNHCAYHYCD